MNANRGAGIAIAVTVLMLCTVFVPMAPSSYASSGDLDITSVDYWEGRIHYSVETDSPYIYIQVRDADGGIVYLGPNPDVVGGRVEGSFARYLAPGEYILYVQGATSAVWDTEVFTTDPAVTGITVDFNETIGVGCTLDIDYVLEPWNATWRDVLVESSDDTVVAVNPDGSVTGIAPGVSYVRVTTLDGGYSGVCTVTVREFPGTVVDIQSVEYHQGRVYYSVDSDCRYLYVQVRDMDGGIVYLGPNPDVTSGNVESVFDLYLDPGQYVLYVQGPESDVWDTMAFDSRQAVTGITMQGSMSLSVGDTVPLQYTVEPWNAADVGVTWTVSDTSVVSVNDDGTIEALSAGVAYLSVTTDDGGFTAYCTVTVRDLPGTTVDILSVEYHQGRVYYSVESDCRYLYVQVRDMDGGIVYLGPNPDVTSGNVEAVFDLYLDPGRYVLYVQGPESDVWDTMAFDSRQAVTGVTMQDSKSLLVGDMASLQYTVEPWNSADKSVTWSSSDTSVATVDGDGMVRAVSAGVAYITVRTDDGGFTAHCTVTVKDRVGTYVDITSVYHRDGVTYYSLESDCSYVYVQVRDMDGGLVYMGPNPDVGDGILSSRFTKVLAPGEYVLYVQGEVSSVNDSMRFTVYADRIPVESITMDSDRMDAVVGGSFEVPYTYAPGDATDPRFVWTVSDDTILHVDADGRVTALAAGTATVTVSCDGASAHCTVTVTGPGQAEVDRDGNVTIVEKETSVDDHGNTVEKETVEVVNRDGTTSSTVTVTIEDVSAGTTVRAEEHTSTEGAVTSEVTVTISPTGGVTAQDISYALELASDASSDFGSEPGVIVSIVADDDGGVTLTEDAVQALDGMMVCIGHDGITLVLEHDVLTTEGGDVAIVIDVDRDMDAPADGMSGIVAVSIDMAQGGRDIHGFEGTVTIMVPYDAPAGSDVSAWYVSDTGRIEKVPCTWEDGVAYIDTTHFSTYIVGIDDGWEPVKEDGHTLLVAAVIAILGIVACLAVAFLRRH